VCVCVCVCMCVYVCVCTCRLACYGFYLLWSCVYACMFRFVNCFVCACVHTHTRIHTHTHTHRIAYYLYQKYYPFYVHLVLRKGRKEICIGVWISPISLSCKQASMIYKMNLRTEVGLSLYVCVWMS